MVTFGGESSIVDVRLSDDGQQTLLTLTHSVPIELAGSGAGALYVATSRDGGDTWRALSDHVPVLVEFTLPPFVSKAQSSDQVP